MTSLRTPFIAMPYVVTKTLWCLTLILSAIPLILSLRRFRNQTSKPKIIGGEETTISEVSYLVNLRQDGYFICGGSLVTAQCILTAAHCTYGVPATSLSVHAGASKLSDTGVVRQVAKNFVSSFYSSSNLNMDVAILKLASPLYGENIATIPLCTHSPSDNELVKISGWGVTTENNRNPSEQVRTVEVPVISKVNCMLAYGGKALLTSTMFCAGVLGEKDSCSGDSGGPVVYKGQVCGIVSWGFGCANKQYPGVYTNLASLSVRNYVRQIIAKNC